ncbi:MAG: HAMP domain-containing histidine kinase [Lachnospiraceae bacterium]|nr:HAMP domain-containing histidine kinase [Lachnospiraceae bacterium]
MKHRLSYSKKYLLISGILMALIVFLALLFGRTITRQFFINRKLSSMIEAYSKLNEASAAGKLNSDSFELTFKKIIENDNISIVMVDSDSETIKASGPDYEFMSKQLMIYLFDQKNNEAAVLKSAEKYEAYLAKDSRNDIEYIDMWGVLDDGNLFLLRSPLGSIEQTARLANNLIAFILVSIGFVLLVIFLIISRRVTVSELREDNIRLQKDIEEKERNEKMRNEFLSNVSHELKTPIALIQGYAEGLKESVNKDEESKDFYCDVIMDEASKMNIMVKKMLDLNQLEFGDMDFSEDEFDIVSLIKNYLSSSEIRCRQKGVELIFDQSEPMLVKADEYYAEEVLDNYFSNALNHVSGNMRIEIKAEELDAEKIRVSVFNTGDPIPEESLERIWEKFYKVDKARTREYGGSGVGLSIVKAIVEKMDQIYGVENRPDGVSFYFTLKKA